MAKDKMTTCKHCGAEIASSAKTCPNCGGKNNKPVYKKVWFWILIAVLVLSFRGCGGRDDKDADASKTADTSVETEAEQEEEPAAEDTASDTEDRAETDISPEFKETMDSYEAFFDEYIEFMKKYGDDPTDSELLAEAAVMMSKEAEMLEKMEEMEDSDMTTAEAAYYLEVTSRIYAKLATVV